VRPRGVRTLHTYTEAVKASLLITGTLLARGQVAVYCKKNTYNLDTVFRCYFFTDFTEASVSKTQLTRVRTGLTPYKCLLSQMTHN